MQEFALNQYVSTPSDAIGKIIKKQTIFKVVYTVEFKSGNTGEYEHKDLSPAPKLTQDEAWERLPILIIEQVEARKSASHTYGGFAIYASDRSDIRYECYKLLGGSGIKVDSAVKDRVTSMVENVARALGIRVI